MTKVKFNRKTFCRDKNMHTSMLDVICFLKNNSFYYQFYRYF